MASLDGFVMRRRGHEAMNLAFRRTTMILADLQREAHAIAKDHGWWDECWQPAKVGHFETREIRDRERAW